MRGITVLLSFMPSVVMPSVITLSVVTPNKQLVQFYFAFVSRGKLYVFVYDGETI